MDAAVGKSIIGFHPRWQSHLPGFVADYDKLKSAGVDVIACVSVNDAFVMSAWGKENGAEGKVCSNFLSLVSDEWLTCSAAFAITLSFDILGDPAQWPEWVCIEKCTETLFVSSFFLFVPFGFRSECWLTLVLPSQRWVC